MEADQPAEVLLSAAEGSFSQADVLWAAPGVAGDVRGEAAATFAMGTGERVLKALLDSGMSLGEIEGVAEHLTPDDLELLVPETAATLRKRIQALSAASQGALSDQVWRIDQKMGVHRMTEASSMSGERPDRDLHEEFATRDQLARALARQLGAPEDAAWDLAGDRTPEELYDDLL